MLTRSGRRRPQGRIPNRQPQQTQPSAEILLTVDEQYRTAAAAGKLRTIAPRRFNPNNEPWLPILHTEAAGWDFTALFSNTARAHELNKTDDWVVIYFDQDGHADGSGHEGQCTVVTETTGALKGKRVIRGREGESRQYYDAQKAAAQETEEQDG
jgi:putative hydrolase